MTDKEKAQAHLNKILGMTDPGAIEGAIGEAAKDLGIGKPSAEPTIHLTSAHVATLPTGERVGLPAGTVLREGTGGLDPAHLLACARGVVDFDAQDPLVGPIAHGLLSALMSACGDMLEDVALRAGPEALKRIWIGGEDGGEDGNEGALAHSLEALRAASKAGQRATLQVHVEEATEAVGMPQELAPTPSVDADPWLDALKLTTANAILSGLERGVPPKEGVARITAAFQAGVDLAIPPIAAK